MQFKTGIKFESSGYIFSNLGGPYRNVQSGSDRYNEPAAAGTLAENYYTLLRPGWAAAHESGDFSGDMNARAAWIRYQR